MCERMRARDGDCLSTMTEVIVELVISRKSLEGILRQQKCKIIISLLEIYS